MNGFDVSRVLISSRSSVAIQTTGEVVASTRFAATATEAPPRAGKVAAALTAMPQEVIDGGEVVILAVKPSMWRPLLDSAPWLASCALLAGALTWLARPLPGFSLTGTAEVILLIAALRFAVAVVRWIPTWYVLTNRRAMSIHGIRSPQLHACLLKTVRTTRLHVSLAERPLRLGSISLVAGDPEQVTQFWRSIPNSEEVHAKVRRAIDGAKGFR